VPSKGQGVLDALLEHLVGEPLVREGARHLERPDHGDTTASELEVDPVALPATL
jgi:hypothetical protein